MRDRILFTRRLSLYLRSGIPLLEALHLMEDDVPAGSNARVLAAAIEEVRSGRPLSSALARFPRAYPVPHTQLIAVGEASGTLPDSLSRLSRLLSRRAELRRTILASLAYPAVLFAGTAGIVGLLMLYVFPKVVPILTGLQVPLPFATRVLLRAGQVTLAQTLCLLAACGIAACGVRYALRYRRIRASAELALLSLPVIGPLMQGYLLATAFRSLHALLASGARMDHALSFTRTGIMCGVYRDSLAALEREILNGQRLSAALCGFPRLYPRAAIQMVAAGELTGTLAESAESIAESFEELVTERAKALSALLEPALMLCMGLAVGFVAFAIITPMYAVTQHLSS